MSGLVLPGDARIGVKPVRYRDLILNTSGLVSAWPLDELSGTNADDKKSTNDGTLNGGVTLAVAGPIAGHTAADFGGSNGYINILHNAALALVGDLTVEMWINPDNRSNWYHPFAKTSGGTAAPYEFELNAGDGQPTMIVGNGTTQSVVVASAGSATGAWSHIAATVAGSTVTHYLNGGSNGSGSVGAQARTDAGGSLRIGARADLYSYFPGLLSWIAVYNRALAAEEVQMHYVAGLRKRKLGLAA